LDHAADFGLRVRVLAHRDYVELHGGEDGLGGEEVLFDPGTVRAPEDTADLAVLVGLELLVEGGHPFADSGDLPASGPTDVGGHLVGLA
jgi:hypothetical protein